MDYLHLQAFLFGFLSESHPEEIYIHFTGLNPNYHLRGFGRLLSERFFEVEWQNQHHIFRLSPRQSTRHQLHLIPARVFESNQERLNWLDYSTIPIMTDQVKIECGSSDRFNPTEPAHGA